MNFNHHRPFTKSGKAPDASFPEQDIDEAIQGTSESINPSINEDIHLSGF